MAQHRPFHTCLLCTTCCLPSVGPKETTMFVRPCVKPEAETGEDRGRGGKEGKRGLGKGGVK